MRAKPIAPALLTALALWLSVPAHPQNAPPATYTKERVTFKSDKLTLVGFLFKPDGQGPFPGLIWNHGSERSPGTTPQFDAVAAIFVPAGYVVFAPMRRGHGDSEGRYIQDELERERQGGNAHRLQVRLLEGEQLDDQLAGQAYLKSLPYVDQSRLAVAGCSYGGIQTLLAAERGAGLQGGGGDLARGAELEPQLIAAVAPRLGGTQDRDSRVSDSTAEGRQPGTQPRSWP